MKHKERNGVRSLTKKEITIGRLSVSTSDWFALLVFIAAAVFLIGTAPYGITEMDEALYQTVAQRLTKGDKLIADEWLNVLFAPVFWYLPYKAFTVILGGTEGILLCLRYLHCAVKLIFFWVVYGSFRRYRYWAVLAAVVYIGFDPFGIKTMNYYSFCSNAVLLTGLLLFVREDRKPWRHYAAGFLFSCAVVAQPGPALLWFVYTVLVFIRLALQKKKKNIPSFFSYLPDFTVWRRMAVGIGAAALLFVFLCAVFFTGTDLKLLTAGMKQVLDWPTYAPEGSLLDTLRVGKILESLSYYGAVPASVFFLTLAASLILHRFTDRYDFSLFLLLCGLYAALSAILLLNPTEKNSFALGQCVSHPFLLAVMGVPAYVFTRQKNKGLFAFLVMAFCSSYCVDILSNVSFAATLLPGDVCAVFLIRDYLAETRDSAVPALRKKRNRSFRRACAALILTVLCAVELANYGYMAQLHETERIFCRSDEPLNSTVSFGAYKGIRTIGSVCRDFEQCGKDMPRVRELCKTGLYIVSEAPGLYLDADVRMSTYCAHLAVDDPWEWTKFWWQLHPDKKPDVIYIPYKDLSYINTLDGTPEEKLAMIRQEADVSVEEGEGGLIVTVGRWR